MKTNILLFISGLLVGASTVALVTIPLLETKERELSGMYDVGNLHIASGFDEFDQVYLELAIPPKELVKKRRAFLRIIHDKYMGKQAKVADA